MCDVYWIIHTNSAKLLSSRSRCLIGVISSSASEQFYSAASFQKTPSQISGAKVSPGRHGCWSFGAFHRPSFKYFHGRWVDRPSGVDGWWISGGWWALWQKRNMVIRGWWVSFKIHQNPLISFWLIPTLPLQDPKGPSYLTTTRSTWKIGFETWCFQTGPVLQTWKVWESYVSCPRWVQLRYLDRYGRDWTIVDRFIYSPTAKCMAT